MIPLPALSSRSPGGLGLAITLFCAALAGTGCGPGSAASVGAPAQPDRVRREVRDLIAALTPLSASALPVERSSWHEQRRRTLERLRKLGPDHGLEALRVYQEEPPPQPEVRAGLLDVAAHGAPEPTTPVLVELVTVFGEDLLVRTKATEFLGKCAPDRAVEVLEPILRERYDGRTYPPEERLLAAWVQACEKLGRDPVPLLSLIATDLHRPQEVRHLATRSLGRFDSPQGRQALQTLMVESSGNAYIRRLAMQSLKEMLPAQEFCQLIEGVQQREADTDFILFLESARNVSCR